MGTFYDQWMQYSVAERERIAHEAGLTRGYIQKHLYASQREPKFHLHNAVAMDQASRGTIPFYQHTEGEIDWSYVLKRLKQAKRLGHIQG